MKTKIKRLTTNAAAFVAGVTVADINRMIDKKILPSKLYSTVATRTVRGEACFWIAFYFETADYLTMSARRRVLCDGFDRCKSWPELRNCKLEQSRTVEVSFDRVWDDVDQRMRQIYEAQRMVVKKPEILGGTPVIKGTRIPVYEVAGLLDSGRSIAELLELYPRLQKRHFEMASLYAKANPQRGRPKGKVLATGMEMQH